MYDPSRKQQLYVAISRMAPNPPKLKVTPEELHAEHRAWLQTLFDRNMLVGSGPARDENNKNHAGAIMIFRCKSFPEAEKLAREEPNVREGQRISEVIPWHRMWFED
jgi:uncharacterized protein YciI